LWCRSVLPDAHAESSERPKYSKVLIYLDDILVMGKDPADMFQKLEEVFDRFRENQLRIHPAKFHWAVKRVKFLGRLFDDRGISVDDSKFSIIRDFPVPTTPKKVRSFLGLANYYRRFVNNLIKFLLHYEHSSKLTRNLSGQNSVRKLLKR
jgi:hypothetical protein